MNWFTFDIEKHIVALLRAEKRQTPRIAWLMTLLGPLNDTQQRFLAFINDIDLRTAITCQVIYIEHILNYIFDPDDQRIYIGPGQNQAQIYIYGDAIPVVNNRFIYGDGVPDPNPDYLYGDNTQLSMVDFIVYVPVTLVIDELLFKATVEYYRKAGKRWKIVRTL